MLTGLIMQFIVCVYTATGYDSCVDILDEIAAAQEVEEQKYTIGVVGYPVDSLANEIVNYWRDQTSGDMDMILTFIAENGGFDATKVSRTNDYGLCQLHYNKTNARRIDDERWSDPMFQAEACVDKWLAVPNPSKVWYGWKVRNKYRDKIYFFTDK